MTAAEQSAAVNDEKLAMLEQSANDFLKKEWSASRYRELIDSNRGFSEELWRKVTELGWPSVVLPEELGGSGGGFSELAVLAQALGRAIAPVPLIPTLVGAHALSLCDNSSLRDEVLPGVAQGSTILSLAHLEQQLSSHPANVNLDIRTDAGGDVLNGTKIFVSCAQDADYFVVAGKQRSGQLELLLVPAAANGVTIQNLKTLDWSIPGVVTFNEVAVNSMHVIASGEEAETIFEDTLRRRSVLLSLELLGVAESALGLAVEYASSRVAFGRPIGAFQAVKHRLVNLRADIEVARALGRRAIQEIEDNDAEASVSAARLAFWAIESLRKVPEGALQVFGGIGFTWDHDVHLYLRRAATLSAMLGERSTYREIVVDFLDKQAS